MHYRLTHRSIKLPKLAGTIWREPMAFCTHASCSAAIVKKHSSSYQGKLRSIESKSAILKNLIFTKNITKFNELLSYNLTVINFLKDRLLTI